MRFLCSLKFTVDGVLVGCCTFQRLAMTRQARRSHPAFCGLSGVQQTFIKGETNAIEAAAAEGLIRKRISLACHGADRKLNVEEGTRDTLSLIVFES